MISKKLLELTMSQFQKKSFQAKLKQQLPKKELKQLLPQAQSLWKKLSQPSKRCYRKSQRLLKNQQFKL